MHPAPNMIDVQVAAAERRLLGLNRKAIQQSANSQCLWEAIGTELARIGHFPERARNLGIRVQKGIAEHVKNDLSEEEWEKLYYPTDGCVYKSKKDYVDRLEGGMTFVGRGHWGTVDDIRMAASWLKTSIYTYGKTTGFYTCVNVQGMHVRVHPETIASTDLLLYNSGNIHWMATEEVVGLVDEEPSEEEDLSEDEKENKEIEVIDLIDDDDDD